MKANEVMVAESSFRDMPRRVRGFRAPRCPRCWMLVDYCVCSLMPRLSNRVPVQLLMQWKESGRSSNTGRLVKQVLEQCDIHMRGRPGQPFTGESLLGPGRQGLLLYPGDGVEILQADMLDDPDKAVLVVPDGTWRWSRRLWCHEPVLRKFRRVMLPPGPPSMYRLRREREAAHLCTYEAVARALGILEGPELGNAMMAPFPEVVERTMKARGRLRKDGSPAGNGLAKDDGQCDAGG